MNWINNRMHGCAMVVTIAMALLHGEAFANFEGGGGLGTVATYYFSGDCLDCVESLNILGAPPPFEVVTAQLVLQNYLSGNPIYAANLVSFTYNGSSKFPAYSIFGTAPGLSIAGVMYGSSGTDLNILDDAEFFDSSAGSPWSWDTGPKVQVSFDQGNNGFWSLTRTAVPEPASLALFVLGLSGLIGIRRRRSK